MRIVTKQSELFKKILTHQEFDLNREYRLIKYIVTLKYKEMYLLFNTLSRQIIALTLNEYDNLNRGIKDNIFEKLVDLYFIVPINHNDEFLYNQIITFANIMLNKSSINNFAVFSTLKCNARCFYCFEHGVNQYHMTNQTAIDVAEFIIKKSTDNVKLLWFGGEPLFNIEPINIISEKLDAASKKFKSIIITNGYLFDKHIVDLALKKWKVYMVQITLDGTEEVYNKCKNYIYKNVDSPFYRVLNNIELLLKNGIKVLIRLNMDNHNKIDLYKLVDILDERFSKYKELISVYVWLLYDNRGATKTIRSNIERHMLTNELIKLEEYIYEKNLNTKAIPDSKIKLTSCMADSDDSTVILPNGDLGKCDHHTNDEIYGSIYSDNIDSHLINSWKERKTRFDLCKKCPLEPECIQIKKCPDDGAYDCDIFSQRQKLEKVYVLMKNAYDYSESK